MSISTAAPPTSGPDVRPRTTDEGHAIAAAGVLARAATAFRHALDEVHDADDAAWASYSRSLDDAVRQLQAELLVARVQLDVERASRPESVHEAMSSAGHAVQERIDTLRVRAHVGRLDAHDGFERTVEDLEHRAAVARAAVGRLRDDATTTLEDARRTAGVVLADVAEVVRLATAVVRDDVVPQPSCEGRSS